LAIGCTGYAHLPLETHSGMAGSKISVAMIGPSFVASHFFPPALMALHSCQHAGPSLRHNLIRTHAPPRACVASAAGALTVGIRQNPVSLTPGGPAIVSPDAA
jgi:hypothetical protein